MHSLTARLCGYGTIALGLELVAGWLLKNESMVRILSTSNSVSFNTAIVFVLAGAALAIDPNDRSGRLRTVVAIVMLLGATAILCEDVFDVALGLDWVSLHSAVQDGSPRPGRVAPNTCLAIILLGVILLESVRSNSERRSTLVPVCCISLAVLITTGIAGLLLDPTLLYGWYKFNRMAGPTAFGLSLLTIGLYTEHAEKFDPQRLSSDQQESRILLIGTLILLAMGMSAAITTSVIFANFQQQTIREKLQSDLVSKTVLLDALIQQSAADSRSLGARPLQQILIQKVTAQRAPADIRLLKSIIQRFPQQGFSSIALTWTDGREPIRAGDPDAPVELEIPLLQQTRGSLAWRKTGFFYRSIIDISSPGGEVIAQLHMERPLPALGALYLMTAAPVGSAETRICGRAKGSIACFPSRLQPSPMVLTPATQRARLPVDDALDGKSDAHTAKDYRDINVVVASSRLGGTGLVVLSKVDTTDLYEPIRFLVTRALLVLSVSLVAGVLLLRQIVGPLIYALALSQARAVASERRLKSITDNVPALIGFVDRDLKYQFMNSTYERWFGQPVEAMLGKTPADLLGKENYENTLPLMQQALRGEAVEFSRHDETPNGNYPQHVTVFYIPDRGEDGTVLGFNVLAFDASERHTHEQRLLHLAHHDSLTGLPNRRLFEDRLTHALALSQRQPKLIALIYLDLDYFKKINDVLGHEKGDMLLCEVAKRLRAVVRSSDTVARLGGDEFVVLMEGLPSKENALIVANKILVAMRAPLAWDAQPKRVTISMGIAFARDQDDKPALLVQRGDRALYEAKGAGRDRFAIFD